MNASIEKLIRSVLDTRGAERLRNLRALRRALKANRAQVIPCLHPYLPQLAECLYDVEIKAVATTTLGILSRTKITTPVLNRLLVLQRTHPNPMVVRALGLAGPEHVRGEYSQTLAAALANDVTSSTAAEVLLRQTGSIDFWQTIQVLENIAMQPDSMKASEAISQLISHSEGSYGESACLSLKKILRCGSAAKRYEIAVKLAWSRRRGLALLSLTAHDSSTRVRLATAISLLSAYRIRGRSILEMLADDSDYKVRAAIASAKRVRSGRNLGPDRS